MWIIDDGSEARRARRGRRRAEGASGHAGESEAVCAAGGIEGSVTRMSKFFINRPIVAMVISILMVIVGAVTIAGLPVAQFPNIAPPEIQIQATYVGADAQTIEQSVATPIEQQMSGVDNMNYMYSLNATANGQMTMIVNFDVKTDPEHRSDPHADARDAGRLAASRGREQLTASRCRSPCSAPLMLIGLYSPQGHLRREVPGQLRLHQPQRPAHARAGHRQRAGFRRRAVRHAALGEARPAGQAAASPSRRSSPPSRRRTRSTPPDRSAASRCPKGQEFTYSVRAQGRLTSPEEFGRSSSARRRTAASCA